MLDFDDDKFGRLSGAKPTMMLTTPPD